MTEPYHPKKKGKRKSPAGEVRSDIILSAHVGGNAEVFPQVLALHVPVGSKVADVTFGKGVFWQSVKGTYTLYPSDIQTGVDCRDLPYQDGEMDCIVLDPPYMEGLFRVSASNLAGSGSHSAFRENYSNGMATADGPKYHAAVLDLYFRAGQEAARVLRDRGILIVKCQDEVSANLQRLTHIEITEKFREYGFFPKDLFVVVRSNRPVVSRMLKQEHARKNHSYFLVFVKTNGGNPRAKGSNGDSRRLEGNQEGSQVCSSPDERRGESGQGQEQPMTYDEWLAACTTAQPMLVDEMEDGTPECRIRGLATALAFLREDV